MKNAILEMKDVADELGKIYIFLLFISGAIWAFIAINNFDTPEIFKISLIYSLLLIFGFLGVILDRGGQKLGIDSRIWESDKMKYQLAIGVGFFAIWYLVFMAGGFSVATAQTVGGSALFTVSPTLNFVLVSVLGPIAENIFFFGVLNFTLVFLFRRMIKDRRNGLIMAGLLFATYALFYNVPNSFLLISLASALLAIASITQNQMLVKYAPVLVTALFLGGLIFPKFHSYAYQLNEQNYIAASFFGIAMCIIGYYIGMLPVDITHIANNIVAVSG